MTNESSWLLPNTTMTSHSIASHGVHLHPVTSGHGWSPSTPFYENASTVDYENYLNVLNERFGQLMLPALVYLALLMAIGVVGNCFVLYVYLTKLKHNTTRSFVLALAVFDLVSCTVAIPGEIVDLLHNYTFGSYVTCKLLRTVNTFSAFASGFTLFVVAVDRYKRICTPLAGQISTRFANMVLLICCMISMALSTPAALLYGRRTIVTEYAAVNGSDCSTGDTYRETPFPLVYNGIQFLVFITGAVGLIALYSIIGKRIWRHRKFGMAKHTPSVFIRCSDSGSDTSPATDDGHVGGFISPAGPVPSKDSQVAQQTQKVKNPRKLSVKIGIRNSGLAVSDLSSPEVLSPSSPTWLIPNGKSAPRNAGSIRRKSSTRRGTFDRGQSSLSNVSKRRESNARRTTLMLFLITIIFILSFLPHLVLMALKAMDKQSLSGVGGLAELCFNIAIRSYFINSVANPIVYSLCCQKFRTEIVKIFKCSRVVR